ncbi:MAG: hypothetical protein ACREMY_07215 [bacterium]
MPAIPSDLTQERTGREAAPRSRPPGLQRSLPDRRNHASREELLCRIWGEFEEMRGLKLTCAQATRLFGVREDVCLRVLNSLIRDGLLQATPEQLFARRRIDT